MAVRPVVDGVELEYEGKMKVIRLNVQHPATRPLAEAYRFQYTPTFVLLGPDGTELWRSVGALDPEAVRDSLGSP
ncbi:MAG TPA: thioredoxin family protein [Anaerolineales bacterium]|nr:thioredoxin family protein [Anaerolineales bacterium]